jgi:hypothetical protein
MTINLKQIKTNTDVGFFLQNIDTKVYSGVDSIKYESFYSPNVTTNFSYFIIFSDWLEVYDREYIKIQDILAMIGGFINFSLIVLKFFINYLRKPQVIDILNRNYHYSALNSKGNILNNLNSLHVSSF